MDGDKVVELSRRTVSVRTDRVDSLVSDLRETLPQVLRWPACAPVGVGDT